jgi:hypothetical protein
LQNLIFGTHRPELRGKTIGRALTELCDEIVNLLAAAGWREVARNYVAVNLRLGDARKQRGSAGQIQKSHRT